MVYASCIFTPEWPERASKETDRTLFFISSSEPIQIFYLSVTDLHNMDNKLSVALMLFLIILYILSPLKFKIKTLIWAIGWDVIKLNWTR